MERRPLKFSEPFVKAEYLEDVADLPIGGKTILLNADDRSGIGIEGNLLRPWASSIFSDVIVPSAEKLIRINVEPDVLSWSPFPYASEIKERWSSVYDIFPLPHFKDTKLWRSEQERVGDVGFNLWFAEAGTDCGIHNEHDFGEVHTQVFGIGRMQKFHRDDPASVYQEVFMSPGYTHEPFYDDGCKYPWHQYHADTDCIWLAVEFHRQTAPMI
jgi:hypothetical protein